jgi:hypothetical protein
MSKAPDPRVPRPDDPCGYRWGDFGQLYGISMGYGWIRTTTDPACPQHGTRAEKARAARIKAMWTEGRIAP